jgi:hypothetical protein
MTTIRPLTATDQGGVVSLLIRDALQRSTLDPVLWRLANFRTRIERAVAAALQEGSRELWRVAEQGRHLVGVSRAMLVPVPPIYDGAAGAPGLILDDCCVSADAPADAAEALLAATAAALARAGAQRLVASCPAAGRLRPLYERLGYEPVTLYLVKHGLGAQGVSNVRPATTADVPGIVQRSAQHRATLAQIAPRFWYIHPEADGRFDAWMRRSLTFADRDMLVAVESNEVRGYVIAQPVAPLLIPAAHEAEAIGVIDDFYDADFSDVATLPVGASSGANLLAAAEAAFARRGVNAALVVCPAAWPSKLSLLRQNGYRVAKLWMLQR